MRVTAETKAATRQRILDEAQALFARNGYEATTTRDIAQAAGVAAGTLFNYFPTKEAVVACLVGEALAAIQCTAQGAGAAASGGAADLPSLEEDLFAHVAAGLRKLKPFRKYLPAVLETTFSPLASASRSEESDAFRVSHLEFVQQAAMRHGLGEALSPMSLQLYWTLYTGVLAAWAGDQSPKQEDTLALLDQSLQMFAGWLKSPTATTQSLARTT